MKIRYSPHFVRQYKKLPEKVKLSAEQREAMFRKDWQNPLLATHKLKGKFAGLWSFSIDNRYRIIFEFIGEDEVHFHEAGDHRVYDNR